MLFLSFVMKKLHQYYKLFIPRALRTRPFQVTGSQQILFQSLRGNHNLASNYRPISLTSTCCKIMKHVIFCFIMDHLDGNNIINNHQHGFRPGYPCQRQLILLTEDIFRAHKQVDLTLFDFCKVFNKIPH